MSTRVKISSPHTKDNKRSDSPGYFTLSSNSDSDTGDCTGDISGEDDDFNSSTPHDISLSQIRNDDNFADSSSSTIVYNFQGAFDSMDGKSQCQSQSSSNDEAAFFGRGKTPPRNSRRVHSPMKPFNQHDDGSAPPSPPPRPPPPLIYTSTLPPPVPKKINPHGYTSRSHSLHHQRPYGCGNALPRQPSAPPISRSQDFSSEQKSKPLQRVQPLQIQSPSVINVLKQGIRSNTLPKKMSSSGCSGSSESTYNSSSDDNPFSSLESHISEKDDNTHDDGNHYTPTLFNNMRAKNISSQQWNHCSSNKSLSRKKCLMSDTSDNEDAPKCNTTPPNNNNTHFIHSTKSDPLKSNQSVDEETKHDVKVNSQDESENKKQFHKTSVSTSTKDSTLSDCSCQIIASLRKSKSRTLNPNDNVSSSDATITATNHISSLQNAKLCVMNKVNALTKSINKNSKEKSRINYDPTNEEREENTVDIRCPNEVPNMLNQSVESKMCKESKHESSEGNLKSKSNEENLMLGSTQFANNRKSNNNINFRESLDSKAKSSQQKKRQTLHNSIYNLIKCYEPDFTRNKTPTSTSECNRNQQRKSDHSRSTSSDDTALSSMISNTVSARLSQLSIESLERINSWLSNPIDSISSCRSTPENTLNSHNLTIKEIDILDQCVNDLIEFTQGTLDNAGTKSHVRSNKRYSIVQLVQNGISSIKSPQEEECKPKLSVQQLVNKIEHEIYEQSLEIDELHTSISMTTQEHGRINCKGNETEEKINGNENIGPSFIGKETRFNSNAESNNVIKEKVIALSQVPAVIKEISSSQGIHDQNENISVSGFIKTKNKNDDSKLPKLPPVNIKNIRKHDKQLDFRNMGQASSLSIIGKENRNYNKDNKSLDTLTPNVGLHQKEVCQSLPNKSNSKKVPAPKSSMLLQSTGKQPIPSPRVKRKARKEKMLQEHKEIGRQALSQLKDKNTNTSLNIELSDQTQFSCKVIDSGDHQNNSEIQTELSTSFVYNTLSSMCTTPSIALPRNSNSTFTDEDTLKSEVAEITINNLEENDNGLDVLEDLCTQSRLIQRELTNTPSISLLNSDFPIHNHSYQIRDVSEKDSVVQNEENRTKVRKPARKELD